MARIVPIIIVDLFSIEFIFVKGCPVALLAVVSYHNRKVFISLESSCLMNRVWAEIDFNALKNNAELSARTVGSEVGVIAVVKADAYGHGAVEISQNLANLPFVKMLGVSSVEEGLELRESGITAPVLVMGVMSDCRVVDCVKAGLTPSVFTENCLVSLSKAAANCDKRVDCHLKIDTGMTRLGVTKKEALALVEKSLGLDGLRIEGVFTHFAHSSAPRPEPTVEQISVFNSFVYDLENAGFSPRFKHMANSAAIQRFPESFGNMVRPGIMLYGSSFEKTGLTSVMRVKTGIVRIREIEKGRTVGYRGTFTTKKCSLLATIPVGYKDGYFRSLSNRASVSIKGIPAPVVGEICMDFTTVDVTDIEGVRIGDEVVLFGDEVVTVEDVARWSGTIPYEVVTSVGRATLKKTYGLFSEPGRGKN